MAGSVAGTAVGAACAPLSSLAAAHAQMCSCVTAYLPTHTGAQQLMYSEFLALVRSGNVRACRFEESSSRITFDLQPHSSAAVALAPRATQVAGRRCGCAWGWLGQRGVNLACLAACQCGAAFSPIWPPCHPVLPRCCFGGPAVHAGTDDVCLRMLFACCCSRRPNSRV